MGNNKKSNIVLFLLCFFLGWLGLDKLYYNGNVKLTLIKFLLMFIIVGIVWNIYDMVCAILDRYEPIPGFIKK